MNKYAVKIIGTQFITHDVKQFTVERPPDYNFIPGQATDVSINAPEWKDNTHPFTFTGLQEWNYLEFTIKIYPNPKGMTHQLGRLKAGDEVIIQDAFGQYNTEAWESLLQAVQV